MEEMDMEEMEKDQVGGPVASKLDCHSVDKNLLLGDFYHSQL